MVDPTNKLWLRDPDRIYPGDFTVHEHKTTPHPSVNGWAIMEVYRVYSWSHSPLLRIKERRFHVGGNLDPKKFQAGRSIWIEKIDRGKRIMVERKVTHGPPGGFLRIATFETLDDAVRYALDTGVMGRKKP